MTYFHNIKLKCVYLHMAHLSNQPERKEVSKYFRDMVDDRCHAEKCWRSAKVLQMPKEERKDKTDSEAHEPSDKQERAAFQIGEMT